MKRKLRETLRRILSIVLMIVMLPLSSLQPAFTAIVHAEGTDEYVAEAPVAENETVEEGLENPENPSVETVVEEGKGNSANEDTNASTDDGTAGKDATPVEGANTPSNGNDTDDTAVPADGANAPAEGSENLSEEDASQNQVVANIAAIGGNAEIPEEATYSRSASVPVEIVNLELSAAINEGGNAVLEWNKLEDENIEYFIYRNDELIDSLTLDGSEGEKLSYVDSTTYGGTEFTYKVTGAIGEVIYGESDGFMVKTPDVLEINSDYTLTSDMTVFEVKHHRGQINLNGHQLIVCKNYVTDNYNANLYLNGGSLLCYGDLKLNYSYSYIYMQNAQDYLYVKGNVVFNNGSDYNDLSNGVFEVAGDITARFFKTKSFNKVILSGSEKQNIDIPNDAYIQYLVDNNVSEEGVNFVRPTQIFGYEFADEAKVFICEQEVEKGFTLFEDTTIDGDLSIGYGVLDLNGYTLTVNGNFIQKGGDVVIGEGALNVKGDYNIENEIVNIVDENEEITKIVSAGRLIMNNASGKVVVEGNFTTRSIANHDGLLTAGTMEFKGDFYQISGTGPNFRATGTHNVLFSGDGKQTIKFTNAWSDQSGFNNLEITNDSEEGVVFDTTSTYPLAKGIVNDHGNKVTGALAIIGSTSFENNHYCSDLVVVERVTINKEIETDGNFSTGEQYDITLSGKITAGGDVSIQTRYTYYYANIYAKGNMYIGGRTGNYMYVYMYDGSINVDGDLNINKVGSGSATRIYDYSNNNIVIPMTVKGNLLLGDNAYCEVSKGILTLGGNLSGNGYLYLSGTHKT
ncbi:MAG: hypothetical protein J6X80_05685, partial [Lachnospiraceae bacterium]|nr:hypothetical protein [Lachnospiraceae bacterium]